MKLTAILLLTACLQVSAKTYSQVITLNFQNTPLDKVVKEIERQTKVNFFYEEGLFQNAKPVTISVSKSTLEEALALSFKNQPFDYKIVGKTVFIRKKSVQSKDQVNKEPLIDIHGRVLNDKGEPVLASISVKGSTKGTTTNKDGWFVLPGIDENATLIISGVGIETTEVKPEGKTQLEIAVKILVRPLDEVQMIAYGTTTRRFNTGSVGSIKSEDIEKQPVNNPLLALQGRIPGVIITQSTGVPGAAINIQIRGRNSIAGKNDPLFIIDGVPYVSQLLPNLGSGILQQANNDNGIGAGNPLSFLNPSDIESISVLKDADATAIYGSRGANGVVLITTKKGSIGITKVEFNFSTGIGNIGRKLNLLNTNQYIEMRKEAFKNDGITPNASNAPDLFKWDTTKYTDWQKELVGGTSNFTNAQVATSGGNSNLQYLIKGNYYKETTVFPGDFYDEKGSIHFNLSSTSTNQRFKTAFSGTYLIDNNRVPPLDISAAINTAPNAPDPLNSDGSLNWANSSWNNPYAYIKRKYKVVTNNLLSNLKISYQLAKGLEISGSGGYTNMQVKEVSITPIASLNPALGIKTGSASFTDNNIHSWILEPQMNYGITIGQGKLDALVGATFQQNISQGQIIDASGYTSDVLLENIQAGPIHSFRPVTYALYKYNAGFGRLSYNWRNRYILNVNGRRDGSSRFGDNNKFHNFGSVALAWIFSEENFIKKRFQFLSFGKIRGSYGTTGNDQIGNYRYYDLFGSTDYTYQNIVGLTPSGLNNPNIQWEKTKKFEASADLGFLKSRILLNASYYFNESSNQLLAYTLPATTGFSLISANFPATVQNYGWEFSISTINIKSNRFSWSSDFNFSLPKNKLAAFPNIENSPYKSSYIVGEPLTIQKLYHAIGVNDSTGVYQFTDSKGTPTYAPSSINDRIVALNTNPKYYGGFGNSFIYKGLQIDFLFQFTKQLGKNYLFQPPYPPGRLGTNTIQDAFSRWQNINDQTSLAKFTQSGTSSSYKTYQFATTSDLAYTDASFIRLKNVSISYNLQTNLIKNLHFKKFRIYLLAQNILTITKYKGTDPETKNISALPPLRVISAGLDLSF